MLFSGLTLYIKNTFVLVKFGSVQEIGNVMWWGFIL